MQLAMHMVTIEDLMPQQHFLRKLEATLDLSFVYGETARLYKAAEMQRHYSDCAPSSVTSISFFNSLRD